jgi:Copper amine oxidase N-terminal domain.
MKSKLKELIIVLVVGITICILSIIGANALEGWSYPPIFGKFNIDSATASNLSLSRINTVTEIQLEAYTVSDEANPDRTEGIRLTWDHIPEAFSYNVFRGSIDPSDSELRSVVQTSRTSGIDTFYLQAGTTYRYCVVAYARDGQDVVACKSNEVIITTGSSPIRSHDAKSSMILKIGVSSIQLWDHDKSIDRDSETVPIIIDGRTFLPIRVIVETMRGTVGWSAESRCITLFANQRTVEMWIGETSYTVNAVPKELDVAPFILNDRTYLPLRFVAENLGCNVTWIDSTKEVLIQY